LFAWAEREAAQEVEVLGCEIRTVLAEILNLLVCDADVGELGDLLLQPVISLAVKLEISGAVGEAVGDLCIGRPSAKSS